jgi:hypothetical protein
MLELENKSFFSSYDKKERAIQMHHIKFGEERIREGHQTHASFTRMYS